MRWQGRRGSRNIEDRRGRRGRAGVQLGGAGVLVVLVVGYFLGIDVTPLLQDTAAPPVGEPAGETALPEADRQAGAFVSVVLADTEAVWTDLFRQELGRDYNPVTLVLFGGVTQSPCGNASGATGPFYCPGDGKVYLDTDFFATLERRLGAGGDFAAAYVVAHEVAHHVQDELGILGEANRVRSRAPESQANAISVRIELMADCLAGVWTRHADSRFDILERGDLAEAINAAKRIGDDTLQRNAGRVPAPHTFTHGTSQQRQRWFRTGYDTGEIGACDTFAADRL